MWRAAALSPWHFHQWPQLQNMGKPGNNSSVECEVEDALGALSSPHDEKRRDDPTTHSGVGSGYANDRNPPFGMLHANQE
jgi:hypothetical protein